MGDSLEAMKLFGRHKRERRQANGQLEIVAGTIFLQANVRGTDFDLHVTSAHHDGWKWGTRGTYTNEEVGGVEKTWLEAFRAACRAADGMAPFRKYEKKGNK